MMQKKFMALLGAGLLSTSMLSSATASEKHTIVTTIPPIQGLVEALVGDLAEVTPLSNAGATPHGRTLKPSDVRKLTEADLVVQVGPTLESSIQKVLNTNVEADHLLTLEEVKGIHLLEIREGGVWGDGHHDHDHGDHGHESHDEHGHEEHGHDDHAEEKHEDHDHDHAEKKHDDHGHDDHAEHDHDKHEDHGHEEHAHEEHGHDEHGHEDHAEHDDHHEGEHHAGDGHVHDAHIWLSVENAKVIVNAVEAKLAAHSPELADGLASRKTDLLAKLDQLDADLTQQLAGLGDVSYLVFHDAYQYFEEGYGLKPSGAVLLDPERKPGAKRLSELRHFVEENNVKCVFTEPQFKPKLVKVLQEDTKLKTGELDPLGFGMTEGEDMYFTLMQNLAVSLKGCLTK